MKKILIFFCLINFGCGGVKNIPTLPKEPEKPIVKIDTVILPSRIIVDSIKFDSIVIDTLECPISDTPTIQIITKTIPGTKIIIHDSIPVIITKTVETTSVKTVTKEDEFWKMVVQGIIGVFGIFLAFKKLKNGNSSKG